MAALFPILIAFVIVVDGLPLEPSQDLSQYFESRIVGGVDAPSNFAPHMAALILGEPVKQIVCGGFIISKKIVMTAAHCIEHSIDSEKELLPSFEVVVGTNDLRSGGAYVKVDSYIIDPRWDSVLYKYDVGALILREYLELSEAVAVISLGFDLVEAGEKSYVTGFGLSGWSVPTTLQLLFVETISAQQCTEGVLGASIEGRAPPVDSDLEICTLLPVGQGVCLGDSGSALVQIKTGHQIGIVSWGFPCAIGAPDVFARVAGIQDFIVPILETHG